MRTLKTLYTHRRFIFFFLAFVVMAISFAPGTTTPVNAQSTGACALPDNQVTGQSNWAVAGLGSWSVVGLGSWSVVGLSNWAVAGLGNWSVAGLGNWSVAGLGNWSVAGLGNWSVAGLDFEDLLALLQEIEDNTIDKTWINGFIPEIAPPGSTFNGVPVAVLVVDDYDAGKTQQHGDQVEAILEDLRGSLNGALPDNMMIHIDRVDISDPVTGSYELTSIVSALDAKMQELEATGFKHFVINMSFGALVPCQDDGIIISDTGETWDIDEFLNQSEGPQKIEPILECVENHGDFLTAHFGYRSFNLEAVNVPVGANNTFGSPANRYQVEIFQPGIQKDMFRADFGVDETITWTVTHGDQTESSVPASVGSPACAPEAIDTSANVTPLLTCVAINPAPETNGKPLYRAYLGYFNGLNNTDGSNPVRIAMGENNRVSPAPFADRGQTRVFETGHVPFAFEIDFNGGSFDWTVETPNGNRQMVTVSLNADTPICPAYPMFGDSLGLIQYLISKNAPVEAFQQILTGLDDNDEDLLPLANLLQSYEDRSASDPQFRAVTMASSGNYARNYSVPMEAPPLWPAQLDTTIAVGASLGSDDPPVERWVGSHLANVMAPGAWYNIIDEAEDYSAYVSGTSYSAPHSSMVAAMWLTHPDACNFGTAEAPQRPLKIVNPDATDLTNDPFIAGTADGSGMPLDCAPNFPVSATDDAASTLLGVPVTVDVLANDSDATFAYLDEAIYGSNSQGTTANGGDLTVNAWTTITYENDNDAFVASGGSSDDTFDYIAADAVGFSTDTATVTVSVHRLDVVPSCEASALSLSITNPLDREITVDYMVEGDPGSVGSVNIAAGATIDLTENAPYTPGTTLLVGAGGVVHDSYFAESNPCAPTIGYFFVVDSESDNVVEPYCDYNPIEHEEILDLSVVPSHKINIVAVVQPGLNGVPADRVEFYINGDLFNVDETPYDQVEIICPNDPLLPDGLLFSLAGDTIREDGSIDYEFWRLKPNKPVTLTAIPYDSDGNAGTPLTISFKPTEGNNKGR